VIQNKALDLGPEIFHLVSSITPIINVDLLIQKTNSKKTKTLLIWRDDDYYKGWHLPGGVIRFKESIFTRVEIVAKEELGTSLAFISYPIEVIENINPHRNIRGHFISLLFHCELKRPPEKSLQNLDLLRPKKNHWYWHASAPPDLLVQQSMYKKYLG
jgi:colanic acid biosynthesis protein WcaH